MRRALLLLFLAALPALAESIVVVDEPCKDEVPESLYAKPLCTDYELNSSLMASAQEGDASALALLEKRYWVTEQYQERFRIAEVLLRRMANDRAVWNELFEQAQLAVRFGNEDKAAFEQWCEEHDFYWLQHPGLLYDALSLVASDPRSHTLLVNALSSEDRDVAIIAVVGLLDQRDLASLPAMDATLGRFPDDAKYVARLFKSLKDERADAIAKKYAPEEEEAVVEDEEAEEQ